MRKIIKLIKIKDATCDNCNKRSNYELIIGGRIVGLCNECLVELKTTLNK